MPAKRTPKKQPVKIDIEPDPELDIEDLVTMTIEAHAAVDAIEPERDEDDPDAAHGAPSGYRISFHAIVPEEIAQEFFQKFVQDGMVSVEFFPATIKRKAHYEVMRR